MGFGTIIAGIYFVAVLIVSGYVVTDTVNRISSTSYQSVLTASNIQLEKVKSSATISGIMVAGNHQEVYVNLTNNGAVRLDSEDFARIDVIQTYTANSTGLTQTYWSFYNSNAPSQNRWALNSTIYPNPFPAVVNPLDWDPSKTLSITIDLAQGQLIRSQTFGYLKVVLPEGSYTAQTFEG